jgi:hypothetical protein
MHLNALVSVALKALPKLTKISMNRAKSEKNHNRNLQRAYNQSDPSLYPKVPSDNSSLITVSDVSESSTSCDAILSLFSPSTKKILSPLFIKCPLSHDSDSDDSPSTSKPKKRLKDTSSKISMVPGIPTTLGFHRIHFDLSTYNVYLPLSIFMNSSLCTINRDYSTLTLKEINPLSIRSKPPQVLDLDSFKKKHGRKSDLTHQAWIEAARNFVRFCKSGGKDGHDGNWYKCWDSHFGFFES